MVVTSATEVPGVKKIVPEISLVMAYYQNPSMLELQYRQFAKYSREARTRLEIIIVDDGSPELPAAKVSRPPDLPSVKIFRVEKDVLWNQDGARNIGALEASGKWLVLTDIDHLVPNETVMGLLVSQFDPRYVHSFSREKYGGMGPTTPHSNSYFLTRELFWRIGGYDETYAGYYGTDVLFRKRVLQVAPIVHVSDLALIRVGTQTVPDAGTAGRRRKNGPFRNLHFLLSYSLQALGLLPRLRTLSTEYRRVL